MKPSASFEQRHPHYPDTKLRLIAAGLLLLIIGGGLWWNRLALLHWGLQRLLDRTSLSTPKFSGFQFGLQHSHLDAIEFSVNTGVGPLAVQLQGATADYDLSIPSVEAIHMHHARLKFIYRATAQPETEASVAGLPFTLQRLNIEQLDLEVDTPWGLSHFAGRTEIRRGPADLLEAEFQDAQHTVRIETGSNLRTVKTIVERIGGGKVFELNADRLDQANQQVSLNANAGSLIEWLTTSEMVPETLRAKMVTTDVPQLRPGIASMTLKLTADMHDNLDSVQGRLMLTRDNSYLASADMKMLRGTATIDGHMEMSATEVFEFIRPWLPGSASGWQLATGRARGTVKLLLQPNQDIAGNAHLKAYDIGMTAGSVWVEDGYFDLDITDIAHQSMALSMNAPNLGVGKELTLHNLVVKAKLLDRDLTLEQATLPVFGGMLDIVPDTVNIDQRPIHVTLGVRNVDLSQLLNSLNYPSLSGTGSISGKLPLRLESDTIEVASGSLKGTRPGVLHYQGPVANDENIAFKALRNLVYHSLQAEVNYRPNGDYHLGLRLEGSNPEVLSGHPLAFNLNLSGQLPELLKNGIQAGNFEQSILEQATTKPAK